MAEAVPPPRPRAPGTPQHLVAGGLLGLNPEQPRVPPVGGARGPSSLTPRRPQRRGGFPVSGCLEQFRGKHSLCANCFLLCHPQVPWEGQTLSLREFLLKPRAQSITRL